MPHRDDLTHRPTTDGPRFLTDADVTALLPDARTAIALARRALIARAEQRAEVAPKPTVHLAGAGFANAMPAALLDEGIAGCKWVSIAPDNLSRGLATAQGLMLLADATTGELRCLMAAGALTAMRTAAVTCCCIDAFTPREADIALLGCGAQARSHLALLDALGYTRVRVYGRRAEAREELAAWCETTLRVLRPSFTASREQAVADADTVVTALSIGLQGIELDEGWLRPDVLLLPIDYASQVGAELARDAVLASDDVEQFASLAPSKLAIDHPIAELFTGSVLKGPRPAGRVVLQNLGNGASDLVFAAYIAAQAELRGVGVQLPG